MTNGSTTPIGQIRLPVTFGQRDNYRTELIDFDVANIHLPYNAIFGYLALAKFMAVTHHGYNLLKMPGNRDVITIASEEKDAVCSLERAYQAAAAEDPDNEGTIYPPKAVPKKKKQLPRQEPQESGVSSGTTSGPAPTDGAPPSLA